MATIGHGSAALAKRWRSPRLIDLSRAALERVLDDEELIRSLEKNEAFRALRENATKIVATEISLTKAIAGGTLRPDTRRAKSELAKRRKSIETALLQLLTRVPVFLYLTDYREESFEDVIHNVEPALFTKVTGLKICDFDTLCKFGVFNIQLLNQAIYAFKRQEASSLEGPVFRRNLGRQMKGHLRNFAEAY